MTALIMPVVQTLQQRVVVVLVGSMAGLRIPVQVLH